MRRRPATAGRLLGLAALAAGTAGGTAGGLVVAGAPTVAAQDLAPALVWQQVLPGATVTTSSPDVAQLSGGTSVVVGAEDGRLYAFHLADGSPVPGWPATTPEPIDSSPAVTASPSGGGQEVVVGSGTAATVGKGGLEAFGPDGRQLWARMLPSPAYGGTAADAVVASPALGPLGLGGPVRATVGVVGQAVYSLDAATGATEPGWPFLATDSVYSSPALASVPGGGGVDAIEGADGSPGVLPNQLQGGWVRAFGAGGNLVWQFHTDDVVTSSPVVGPLDGQGAAPDIVVGGGDYWYRTTGKRTVTSTTVTALSLSGQVRWRRDLGGVTSDSPALADLVGNGQLDTVEGTVKGSNDQLGGPGSGMVWALGPSGQPLPGWPVDPVPGAFVTAQVSTADLLGNGQQDVLVPTPEGLFAYGPAGQELFQVASGRSSSDGSVDGHPVVVGDAPLVTNDANGTLGITIAGFVDTTGNGIVQHYELRAGRVGQRGWPMWRHDPALTADAASPLAPDQVAPQPPASHIPLTRLAGASRDDTSVAVSSNLFPAAGSAGAVVLASDADYPDALAGTPLAVAKHAPVLLTSPSGLSPVVKGEIQRVLPKGSTVYLLGGTSALSPDVASTVAGLGDAVIRLSGPNRFATAAAIATGSGSPAAVLEATGTSFPDALAAGAAAAKTGAVVLLTDGPVQSPETAAYLAAHPGGPHYAIGGPAARADPSATQVAGSDRFATSTAVAARFFPSPGEIGLASGVAFPDALSGGAHIGAKGGPVILVPASGPLPASLRSYLSALTSATSGFLYGGTSAVGADVAAEIG